MSDRGCRMRTSGKSLVIKELPSFLIMEERLYSMTPTAHVLYPQLLSQYLPHCCSRLCLPYCFIRVKILLSVAKRC